MHLQDLRCERDDSHELLVAQLAAHRPEDARAPRLLLVVDEDGGVLVEADVAAVRPPLLLLCAHDHALHDVALLDRGTGDGVLDGGHEHVPDRRVAPLGAAQHLDAEHLLGTTVVGDAEPRFLLDHLARSSTSTTRQRFRRDSGRVSCTRTRSPTRTSLVSSWAYRRLVRWTVLA